LWDHIPFLKDQLTKAKDEITKAMDMLVKVENQKKEFENSEENLKKKEKELEALEKEFLVEIEQRLREAEDRENQWKKREADVARVTKAGDQIVKVNLMDKEMLGFSKSKLTSFPNTRLANTFSGAHSVNRDEEGRVFLDNDPEAFKLLLKYLNYEDKMQ